MGTVTIEKTVLSAEEAEDKAGHRIFKDFFSAIEQLVRNSYDEDAEHVTIQYDPGHQLVI